MSKRLLGVVVSLLLLLSAVSGPALAVEEGGAGHELPPLEEVVRDTERAQEFVPEDFEVPGFLMLILVALLAVAVLVLIGVALGYLVWQPRFAQERKAKEKVRR